MLLKPGIETHTLFMGERGKGSAEDPSYEPAKRSEVMVLTMQQPAAVPVILDEK